MTSAPSHLPSPPQPALPPSSPLHGEWCLSGMRCHSIGMVIEAGTTVAIKIHTTTSIAINIAY